MSTIDGQSIGQLAYYAGRAASQPGGNGAGTVAAALDGYLLRYRLSARRGFHTVEMRARKHLKPFFGARAAGGLTEDDLVAYWSHRAGAGAANATVKAELHALRRALNIARAPVPRMPDDMPSAPARVGFLERADFERLCAALPATLQDPFRFAYITGWRLRSEVLALLKTDVDPKAGWVYLRDSKNRESRKFPLHPRLGLRELVERRLEAPPTTCPFLFHRFKGKPIRDYYRAWRHACRVVGLTNIPHDFRRSAVRNLCNAGIDQTTAMLLTGHKTADVFRRYRIVNEGDLRNAAEKLAALG